VVSRSNYKTKIIFNTNIRLYEGWNIIGMSYDIANVKEFLSNKCILSAKKFEDGFWKEYNVLNNINDIETLKASDALYIYSTEECTIEDIGERVFEQNEINIKSFYIKSNNITDINKSNHIDLIDDIQIEDNTTQDEEFSQETTEEIEEEQTQESSQETIEETEEEQTQTQENNNTQSQEITEE
jgi:cobalamin biosynthesis protein CobT